MKSRNWGRVIYISSIMGLVSRAGRDVYSATKAALIGLCRANALELGGFGITANCLAPGPFLTDLPKKLLSAARYRNLCQAHGPGPLGRSTRTSRAGPALGKRRGQLHHGPDPRRRRRDALHDVLSALASGGCQSAGSGVTFQARRTIKRFSRPAASAIVKKAVAEPWFSSIRSVSCRGRMSCRFGLRKN